MAGRWAADLGEPAQDSAESGGPPMDSDGRIGAGPHGRRHRHIGPTPGYRGGQNVVVDHEFLVRRSSLSPGGHLSTRTITSVYPVDAKQTRSAPNEGDPGYPGTDRAPHPHLRPVASRS
ncbi:hypothetical protein GCM10009872_61930 [Actinopolymorpha rutila]